MAVNFEKEPSYDAMIRALLERTREGKLEWNETADEDAFLAAVKGQRTFEIRTEGGRGPVQLVVRDAEGKVYLTTPPSVSNDAISLYRVARRLALRVDERVEDTVHLLDAL
jgi:hypothetical protein